MPSQEGRSGIATDSPEWKGASARRLNTIAQRLRCQSYLEIGVCTGTTFLAVEVEQRTGVDPEFSFDTTLHHDGERIQLLSKTSDQFFAELDPETKYDLIFLDGLHTYDQTYRDLNNALLHSHPGTVILIDDTWPCDVFSTQRDMGSAHTLRRRLTGSNDLRWHGDTYKIMPLIALCHPAHHYVTIVDRGNPQTLMWRPKPQTLAHNDKPPTKDALLKPFLALENMSACDYLWFVNNRRLYHPTKELDALETLFSERSSDQPPGESSDHESHP